MLPVLLVSIVLILVAVGLLSVRLLLIKGGKFRGTCAGNSPYLNQEGIKCGVCGRSPGDTCGKDESKTFISESPS